MQAHPMESPVGTNERMILLVPNVTFIIFDMILSPLIPVTSAKTHCCQHTYLQHSKAKASIPFALK